MFWMKPRADAGDGISRASEDNFWYIPAGSTTGSGVRVSADAALALTAVYACVKVISEAVMQLPLILYRRTVDGGKERAIDHPLYSILKDTPNNEQTAAEWREVMQHHLLLRGNSYAELQKDGGRNTTAIDYPLHPDHVVPEPMTGGRLRYVITEPGRSQRVVLQDDMLHLRALTVNRHIGMDPITAERESLGVGLAAQDFSARFFKNDAQPPGWIEHPSHFANDDDRAKFKRAWQQSQAGGNRFKTALLEHGLQYHPVQMRLRDAEFLATRKYQNLDVCRIFRVPPHLIMELERATFSNISSQGIEFVKFTLLPWFIRWEQRLGFSLLNPIEQQFMFFEFLVDGLERGDPETRSNFYGSGITNGWLTRNEVRVKENMDPLEGLDEPLQPMNMGDGGAGTEEEPDTQLKDNAARALARKQAGRLNQFSPDTAAAVNYLRNDSAAVARFMAWDQEKAAAYSAAAAENFNPDTNIDEWEQDQVRILMEI